jgi:hypothetical protein
VATIGRAFRSLWRESDMGGQIKRRSTLQLIIARAGPICRICADAAFPDRGALARLSTGETQAEVARTYGVDRENAPMATDQSPSNHARMRGLAASAFSSQ